MANDIEIEIRLPLHNPEEVKEFLYKNGEIVAKDLEQRDTYFNPSHRDFLKPKYPFEWLRLRETGKGAFITYKHYYPENVERTDYCDEFESRVDNVTSLRNIFDNLGMKELVVVEKTRNSWMLDGVEISLDDVKGLGYFIELEAKKEFEDPKDGKRFLFDVLGRLNAKVGKEKLKGYPSMILEKL